LLVLGCLLLVLAALQALLAGAWLLVLGCLLLVLAALQALLAGAWLLLIPYERTCIEVLAASCLCGTDTLRTNPYRSACWCLLHYRPCLLVLGCLLPVLACVILIPYERTRIEELACWCLVACYWCLLHYRPCLLVLGCLLPVLACVILIPYERTCIEVLAAAFLCGTDTLQTNPYRSACLCLLHYRFVPCWCLLV